MSLDDLIAAFSELAEIDPDMRIDRTKVGDLDEIRLAAWGSMQTKHKFEALASDAVALFAPMSDSEVVTHWLCIVGTQAPELVEPDPNCLGYTEVDGRRVEMVAETISHAASASVLAVRRLRDAQARLWNRVSPAALAAALERCPTLESALVYLARQDDEGPVAAAIKWVHGQCSWQSLRNGGELWDYVGQRSRDEIIDATVREIVVPQLDKLSTPDICRALWLELLAGFPDLATTLLDESRPDDEPGRSERFTPTPADRNILQALAEAPTTLIQVEIEQASGEHRRVKERLPMLEGAGLVDRPHGERKGYAITDAGRQVLG